MQLARIYLDRADGPSVHYAPFFPGSSAVEQVTVNHWVGGSNPSPGGAIFQYPSQHKVTDISGNGAAAVQN